MTLYLSTAIILHGSGLSCLLAHSTSDPRFDMAPNDTLIIRAALDGKATIYRDIEIEGSKSLYRLAGGIVSAFGYALLGVASWAWLTNLFKAKDGHPGMRLVLSLVALACLVLGVAYLGLLNELIEVHRHFHIGLRRQGVSYVSSMIGFCLTALGFWIAGRVLSPDADSQHARSTPTPPLATTSSLIDDM